MTITLVSVYVTLIYRLFFNDANGKESNFPLSVESVFIIQNSLNLEKQIKAITLLDNIISNSINTNEKKLKFEHDYGAILSELISVILGSKTEMKFNPYLYKTFESFRMHKEKISISVDVLGRKILNQNSLKNLLFPSLKQFKQENPDPWTAQNYTINLINPIIFETFKNAKKFNLNIGGEFRIHFENTSDFEMPTYLSSTYSFSLLSFLSQIERTGLEKINIHGVRDVASSPFSSSSTSF